MCLLSVHCVGLHTVAKAEWNCQRNWPRKGRERPVAEGWWQEEERTKTLSADCVALNQVGGRRSKAGSPCRKLVITHSSSLD